MNFDENNEKNLGELKKKKNGIIVKELYLKIGKLIKNIFYDL